MNKKSPSELRTEFYAYFKSLTPEVIAEFQGNFPISNPEGHMLSGKNISFLKFQGGEKIEFTVVAGYRQWKKFDRQVIKGQHGFWIFIPAMIKSSVEMIVIFSVAKDSGTSKLFFPQAGRPRHRNATTAVAYCLYFFHFSDKITPQQPEVAYVMTGILFFVTFFWWQQKKVKSLASTPLTQNLQRR